MCRIAFLGLLAGFRLRLGLGCLPGIYLKTSIVCPSVYAPFRGRWKIICFSWIVWVSTGDGCLGTTDTGEMVQGASLVADEGGNPLTFAVSSQGDVSGAQYNVYIMVEEL
jgi:hypothetical protein